MSASGDGRGHGEGKHGEQQEQGAPRLIAVAKSESSEPRPAAVPAADPGAGDLVPVLGHQNDANFSVVAGGAVHGGQLLIGLGGVGGAVVLEQPQPVVQCARSGRSRVGGAIEVSQRMAVVPGSADLAGVEQQFAADRAPDARSWQGRRRWR